MPSKWNSYEKKNQKMNKKLKKTRYVNNITHNLNKFSMWYTKFIKIEKTICLFKYNLDIFFSLK